MPESFKKALIAVVAFIIIVFGIKFALHSNYAPCYEYTPKDVNMDIASPSTYLPKVYKANEGCMAIISGKVKSNTTSCRAMDKLYGNITLIYFKDADREKVKKHLNKALSTMNSCQHCRTYPNYTSWIKKALRKEAKRK